MVGTRATPERPGAAGGGAGAQGGGGAGGGDGRGGARAAAGAEEAPPRPEEAPPPAEDGGGGTGAAAAGAPPLAESLGGAGAGEGAGWAAAGDAGDAGVLEETAADAPPTGVPEPGVGGVSLQLPGEATSTLILVGDAVYLSPEDRGGCLRLARIVSFSQGAAGQEARAVLFISPADVDLPADLVCSPNEVFETDLLVDVPVTEIVGRARIVTPRPGSAPGDTRAETEETHVCSKFIDTGTGTVTDLVLDRGEIGLRKRQDMAPSEDGTPGTADLGARESKRSRGTPPAGQVHLADGENALGETVAPQGTPKSAGGAAGAAAEDTPWSADEIDKGKEALFSMLVDIEATSASRAVNKMTLSTAALKKLGDMGLMQHCLRALLDGGTSHKGYYVRQKSSMRGDPLLWLHQSGAEGVHGGGPGEGLFGGPSSHPTSPTQRDPQPRPFATGRPPVIGSGGQPSTEELRELRQDVADLRQEIERQKYENAPQANRGKAKKLSSRDVTRITKSCLSIMRRELKLALLTNYDGGVQRSAASAQNLGDLTGLFASSETANARHREVMHRHLQLRRDLEGMQADIRGRVKKCEEKCAWAVGTCEGLQDRLQGGVEALVRAQQELKKEISTVLFESMQALNKLDSKIEKLANAHR